MSRADTQPSGTKDSDGPSLARGAGKVCGNQELLLLLRVSATHPCSEQFGAGSGTSWDTPVHPKQNYSSNTPFLLVQPHTSCTQGAPPGTPALSQFMAPASLSCPAAALAVPSHSFHSERGEAHRDLSQPCHPLHVGSTIDHRDRCFEINCRGNTMSASQQGLWYMQPSLGHAAAVGRKKSTRGRILGSRNFRPFWGI